jgi:PTH1 family peptidyl-tRNA hydrolase
MFCVVGLGNPGAEYTGTRHNLGFRVADELAARYDTRIRRRDYSALTATVRMGRTEVLLMKPQTFMNLSGRSMRAASRKLGIPADRWIVVCDDADLPLGKLRVRSGGGTGGHRGIASIVQDTGERNFVRVRLGLGRPEGRVDLADWVLERIGAEDVAAYDETVDRAADAVECIVKRGVQRAMQEFNGQPNR